jgi:CRP-like cAMP-binding protein
MKRHNFSSGEIIFQQNARSDAAYLVMEGEVEILRQSPEGSVRVLDVLGRGSYFGEMGVIDDQPRSASARAKGAVVCLSVERKEFMDMLLNNPQEAIDLLKVLFDRLRRTSAKLARLQQSKFST